MPVYILFVLIQQASELTAAFKSIRKTIKQYESLMRVEADGRGIYYLDYKEGMPDTVSKMFAALHVRGDFVWLSVDKTDADKILETEKIKLIKFYYLGEGNFRFRKIREEILEAIDILLGKLIRL